jgi:hypothetical protein
MIEWGDQLTPNPQIERDASPAALRLLARAPHLERRAAGHIRGEEE